MAKEQFNVTLPTEVINMVTGLCATPRGAIGKSELIETLIRKEWATMDAKPTKRIEPLRSAKGKTIGWVAFYGDHRVGEFDLLDKAGAQAALDAYVYEELSR